MAHDVAVKIIEDLIPDWAGSLVDSDGVVASLIAQTNAVDWGFDTYESLNAWFNGSGKINFSGKIILSGEQDPDQPPCGSYISFTVQGEAVRTNEIWHINSYQVSDYQLNDY